MPENIDFEKVRDTIVEWFLENKINYFFRLNRNPYKVWISEVVLQQTRLSSALQKMENFFNAFPDLNSLAESSLDKVLSSFKGLGYYNRARQIHEGAKKLKYHSDFFNGDIDLLKTIPSIGPYTAAAISSICFNNKEAVIDGNIIRIFSRIYKTNLSQKNFSKEIQDYNKKLFNNTANKPGDINESLMEFGQQICKVRKADCINCIINTHCLAYKENLVENYPVKKTKEYKKVKWDILFFRNSDKILMEKYANFYFLKNQFGFPSQLSIDGDKIIYSSEIFKKYFLRSGIFFNKGPKHSITNHKIEMFFHEINGLKAKFSNNNFIWVKIDDVPDLLVSSAMEKTWKVFLNKSILPEGGLEPPRD